MTEFSLTTVEAKNDTAASSESRGQTLPARSCRLSKDAVREQERNKHLQKIRYFTNICKTHAGLVFKT